MRAFTALLLLTAFVFAGEITAYYNKNCNCCEKYFSKLEREGFKLKKVSISPQELMEVKERLKVPVELRSCHTMVYEGRFIEGHVKPEGVRKAIKNKSIRGVASMHGIRSGRGEYEEEYKVVRR